MSSVPYTELVLWLVLALLLPSLLYAVYRVTVHGQEPRRSKAPTTRPGYDVLTDLSNDVLFIEQISEALGRAENGPPHGDQSGFAVLITALEGLEFVNARFSTEAGDAVLVEMAARLKACVGKDELLARSGGNEFAIFVTQLASQAEALRLAERIQLKVRTPFKIHGHDVHLRCSIGVAFSSHRHRHPNSLIRDAKIARYRAQLQGKGYSAMSDPPQDMEVASR